MSIDWINILLHLIDTSPALRNDASRMGAARDPLCDRGFDVFWLDSGSYSWYFSS